MAHVQLALAAWLIAILVVRKRGPFDVFRFLKTTFHLTCEFCTAFWAWAIIELLYISSPEPTLLIARGLAGFAIATLAVGLGGHIISEDN